MSELAESNITDPDLTKPKNAGEIGRDTDLSEALTLEIRKRVLDSMDYIEIQRELGIKPSTWDRWVWLDYKDFRKDLLSWKKERMVRKSESVMESLVYADDDNVRYKAASFLLETQGKDDGYSKRSELTGKNGEPLSAPITPEEQAKLDALLNGKRTKQTGSGESDNGNDSGA